MRSLPLLLALAGCGDKEADDDCQDTGDTGEDCLPGGGGDDSGLDGDSGDSGDDSGDPGTLSPAQQFLYDYGKLGCDLYQMCAPPQALEHYSYEQCMADVQLAVDSWVEGACTYNEEHGEICLDYLLSIDSCEGYGDDHPPECETAMICPD